MIRVRPRADRWRRRAARHIEFRGRRITDDDLARWRDDARLFDELFRPEFLNRPERIVFAGPACTITIEDAMPCAPRWERL